MYNEKDFDIDVVRKALGDMHLIQLKLESDLEYKNLEALIRPFRPQILDHLQIVRRLRISSLYQV